MKIKIILITGLLLFTFVNVIPTAKAGLFINLSSYLQTDYDATNFSGKPIVPEGEIRSLTMYFNYGVNSGGLFKNLAKLLLHYYRNRQVNIKLEIGDYSPWCTPTLFNDVITTKVGEAEQTRLQATLNLRVDLDAPAYDSGFVDMKVTVPKVGMIEGYSNTFTLEFNPAYLPLINIDFPHGNHFIITPYNQTVIPIDITNFGNGQTKVKAEIVNSSKKWNVSITNYILLDIGTTAHAYLTVTADSKFDIENITIKFTPEYAMNELDSGSSQFKTVIFGNDGSYKIEEKDLEIDTTLLLLIIIIVLIIIIITMIFHNKIRDFYILKIKR